MTKSNFIDSLTDRLMRAVGTTASLLLHTLIFLFFLSSHWFFGLDFDTILLVLTTVVSLEAIYLAIFIQRSVNQQSLRLNEVEEALDDVEESIDEVEETLDDVEEALDEAEEDIADIAKDTVKQMEEPLDEVVAEMKKMLKEFKAIMKDKDTKN